MITNWINAYINKELEDSYNLRMSLIKQYCIDDGYPEDYDLIVKPLVINNNFKILRLVGGLEFDDELHPSYVRYLNLNLLSLLITNPLTKEELKELDLN